jgi:hypothetical protein
MKKILYLFLFLTIGKTYAQDDKYSLPPCGTPTHYQEKSFPDIDFSRGAGDTILYVPLTIHQMGNDNGGYYSTMKVLDAFNRINLDYTPSKIHFFMEGDIRFVPNTFWNNHKTIQEGWDMMKKNNVKNTINCYVTFSAAGNCGYNTPYGGVALARGCTGPSDHTWAHELGHALRLPHPFLGWESKTYDPNKPTPTKVTYDYSEFKDTLIPGLKIIDTAYVEMVDKSNCKIAADQMCDTKPDYISTRWNCDANKESPGTYKDPNGATFKSDGTLYMSYSLDACQTRFSDDETAVMRGTLQGKKKSLLYNQVPKAPILAQATVLISPADNSKIAPDNILLQWEKVDNATHYVVEITRLSSFDQIDFVYITSKTEIVLPSLLEDKKYYWKARGFNSHYGGTTSLRRTFATGSLSDVKTIDAIESAVLFPNPTSEKEVTLRFSSNKNFYGDLNLVDFTGKNVISKKANIQTGENSFTFDLSNVSKGLYFVVLKSENGTMTKKLVVE